MGRPRSGVGAPRDQVVEAGLDLDAVLGAPHDHGPLEDVLPDDHPVPLHALDVAPGRRQAALELQIRLILVPHAALEPTALTRELRLVEREPLLLHHLDGDGLELPEPRRAAELAPADAEPAGHLGLVARPDLLHLHARAERLRERARQLAKIHPILGEEVEGRLRPVERPLRLDELHREATAADVLEGRAVRLALALEVLVLSPQVTGVRLLDHPLQDAGLAERSRRDRDRTELRPALGLDQAPVVAAKDQRTRVELVDLAGRTEADSDGHRAGRRAHACVILIHHADPSTRSPTVPSRSSARSASSMVSSASTRLAFRARASIVSQTTSSWRSTRAGGLRSATTRTAAAASGLRRGGSPVSAVSRTSRYQAAAVLSAASTGPRDSSCASAESTAASLVPSSGSAFRTAVRMRASSSPASARARPGEPSASAASKAACSGATPRAVSTRTTASGGSGSMRTVWQRERTVGSNSAAEAAVSRRTALGGGSA